MSINEKAARSTADGPWYLRQKRRIYFSSCGLRKPRSSLVRRGITTQVMVITITGDYGARLRSYELLAREFALPGA